MAGEFNNYILPRSGKTLQPSTRNKTHYLSITDIISEGPILGLTRGAASIYLDNAPAADGTMAGHLLSAGLIKFTFDGTTSVTVPTGTNLDDHISSATAGTKFLQILDRKTHSTANAVRENVEENVQITLTATGTGSATFFEDGMVWDVNNPGYYLELSVDGVTCFLGKILTKTSGSEVTITPTGELQSNYTDRTGSNTYKIHIHSSEWIDRIIDDAITLQSSVDVPTGDFYCDITDARYESDFKENNIISDTTKHKGFSYQFRTGGLYQPPIADIYQGSGATSITTAPGSAFTYKDAEPTAAQALAAGLKGDARWPYVNTALDFGERIERTAGQLNLSTATARQVDEIKVVVSYPGGLVAKNHEGNQVYDGLQAYLYEINIDRGDGNGFTGWQNIHPDGEFYYHTASTTNDFFIQDDLSLDRFKPFKTFKLGFTKATRDDVNPTSSSTYETNRMNVMLASTLQTITCVIRERFTYPYTAYANIRVNAETFNSIPKRSYLCRGRKLLVPSNYNTREETGGAANYRRNIVTGVLETEDQDWDGDMRNGLVYTDNPAWVFYDMLTNTRYGLGEWLVHEDIDKYALYRIARYCDEEVPDGKGGVEPRFRANIYLSKKAETYKVLKDMATTFRSILYWSKGSIIPVIDQAKEPIYNFTKGNVINGVFKYEGTGSKLRSNQIGVTWNNPENDYVPEILLVEDRENIVKTGKIITEEAVAFGCTSMGQATRYGRWKLWTAINQSEVVSFKTAINATFISPGDIVNIQDADRYDVSYSGRVSNTQDEDQELIVKLDRDITLDSNSTYTLSVLIDGAVAYLAQDGDDIGDNTETETKISGTLYKRGDVIATSLYLSNGLPNEEEASDIKDVNDKIVQIQWSPHNHVETREVTAATIAATQPVNSLTVGTAFSTSPLNENIWLLKETQSELTVAASAKMYKILSIKEENKNEFGVQAVEHYNEKFEAVDKDFARPYVDTLLIPSTFVPAPTNVTVTIE